MNTIKTLEEAVEKLYELSVGVIGTGDDRLERPHKPVMLLAVLDMLAGLLDNEGFTGGLLPEFDCLVNQATAKPAVSKDL
jgi:hypothetical protein